MPQRSTRLGTGLGTRLGTGLGTRLGTGLGTGLGNGLGNGLGHRLPDRVLLEQHFRITRHCAKIVSAPFIIEDESWNTALADRWAP